MTTTYVTEGPGGKWVCEEGDTHIEVRDGNIIITTTEDLEVLRRVLRSVLVQPGHYIVHVLCGGVRQKQKHLYTTGLRFWYTEEAPPEEQVWCKFNKESVPI